jgi:circadian clock protein KaiC
MTAPNRALSGIEGLDVVLGGGFPAHRLYLIEGDPGTGKTTLALQFLLEGVRRGEPAVYVTLTETKEELQAVADSHGWSLDGIAIHELANDENLRPDAQYTVFHPSEVELGDTMNSVFQTIERVRPRRAVFDSLSEMRLLARDALRYRRQILAIKQVFVDRQCTVLLLDESAGTAGDAHLQTLVHGVVRLEQLLPGYGGERRRLRVIKVRGVDFRGGNHDFAIRTGGIQAYPRLVAAEHHEAFPRQLLSSGLPPLDELVGGGLGRGTTTLILGPAGSGKTLVASHFVAAAARRGEPAAMFLFDEGRATLLAATKAIGIDLDPHVEAGRVTVQQVDSAELSPGELIHRVRDLVENHGARVIVLDSLNGYVNSMPEERFLLPHLHELFSYLRQRGVVALVIMSQHGIIGTMQSTIDVSHIADSVVVTRFFEAEGSVRKAISVVKKRAGGHEDTIRELTVTSDGVRLSEPLREFRGILTGVPEHLGGPRLRSGGDGDDHA